jgi:recombination protein RecA
MATKKNVETEPASSLFDRLSKSHSSIIRKAGTIPLTERIPTGIAGLDVVTGGGWPKGRICEISGPESMGKSAIMLQSCRQEIQAGNEPLFIDLERTLTLNHIDNLEEHGKLIESNQERLQAYGLSENLTVGYPVYGEETIDLVLKAVELGSTLLVVDSLPLMIPKSVAEKIDDDSTYTAPAMAIAGMFNRLAGKLIRGVELAGSCLVFINQVRDKVNSMHGGTHTPGGHSIHHAFSLRIELTHSIKDKDKPGLIRTHIKINKNKTHTPLLTTEIPILNGVVQLGRSLVFEAVRVGIIEKKGAWYKFSEEYRSLNKIEKENVGNGEEKAGEFLESNQELYSLVYKDVLQKNGIT